MARAPHLPLTRAARRPAAIVAMTVALLSLAPPPASAARIPTIRVRDAQAAESTAKLLFAVKVRGRHARPLTVRFETADETATAGEDYEAVSGKLRFRPRQKVRRIVVPVLGDAVDEPDETFRLRLRKTRGGRLVDRVALGTILDDDPGLEEPTGALVINEVDYDQVGTDDAEFLEVLNSSTQNVDLPGVELHLVNGSTLASYEVIDLSSPGALGPGSYLLVAMAAVTGPSGTPRIEMAPGVAMQNGPDGLALVLRDAAGCTLLDALSYEGALNGATLEGCDGLHDLVEGTPTSAADSNADPGSLARLPDGTDTNDAATDWAFTATLTPGAANAA